MEADAVALARPPLYVVRVTGKTASGAPVLGTGFIVDAVGHVATCRHVVHPTADGKPVVDLQVKLPYPAERPYAYRVLATSPDDLALLESTVPLDFPVPEARLNPEWARKTTVGDAVAVWGFSAAEHYTQAQRFECTVSGLSGVNGRIGLSGNINAGDSGAPVLDRDRHLIGIAQAKDSKRDGQSMAIPVSLLLSLLRESGLQPASVEEATANVWFQVPSLPGYTLVGRDPLLKDLKQKLVEGGDVALCFKPGVGKSALATALANDDELRSRFDGGVLWASLNLTPNVLSELKKWGTALGLSRESIEELDLITEADGDPVQVARRALERWAAALSRQIGQRRMLLVIDDAWEIESANALLLNAPNCSHLVTTREQVAVAGMLGDRFDITVVDELTEEDGLAFLRELAPKAVELFPEKARDLFHAVGGLPQGLLLLGMHLRKVSWDGRRRRIADAFEDIQDALDTHIGPLFGAIRISYEALPDDDARWALQALSVFRAKPGKFSEEAALAVLEKPAAVIDVLNDSGLIETVDSGDDQDDLPYTMHRTIAEFASGKLSDEAVKALHRRAAAYFSRWLKEFEETDQDEGAYGYQYRYENARWQDAMDDFLYHLARAGHPEAAILGFGSIYFNAFWWWGCYTDFPFCTRVLRQAASKRLSDEARRALDLLAAFDAAYPKETAREQPADWNRVEEALVRLRAMGGLDRDVASIADPVARHTRALTDIFLAEAFRFGREDFDAAERLYRDALALLPDTDWSRPWVLYHLGDLLLESGRPDEADRQCSACLEIAEDPATPLTDRDNEIIANAYRLRAEIALSLDREDDLRNSVERIVLHAYAFQAVPAPPDNYTIAFYRQMTDRTARLLQAVHRQSAARAVRCCVALRDYWRLYRSRTLAECAENAASDVELEAMLTAPATDALCAYLFPAAPTADVLHRRGTRYFNEAVTVLNEKMTIA